MAKFEAKVYNSNIVYRGDIVRWYNLARTTPKSRHEAENGQNKV